jgi:hypothetical protein
MLLYGASTVSYRVGRKFMFLIQHGIVEVAPDE